MTMEQLASYFIDNEDSTSVKIKSFHQSTKNIYPDLSFCVKGSISEHMSNRNQFNESRLPNNISSEDLANMLNGEEANDLQKNAAMRQLIHHLSNNNSLSFDDILNEDAKNVIKYYWMTSTSLMNDWDSNFLGSEGNKNFDKTMESNLLRCWTRKFNYTLGQLIKEEGIVISKETITKFPRLVVSLHQKNQWIRTTTHINLADRLYIKPGAQKLPMFVITVQNVKLITRRHNAKEKCNTNLHNDDFRFLQEASKIWGCIPIFWKEFSISWILALNLTFCTKPEDYKNYYLAYSNWDSRYLVYNQYDPPCTKVSVTYDLSTVEYDIDPSGNSLNHADYLFIRIIYESEDYEEITNLRKFNTESMISQIGGFIGIALGVSLLHIPVILQTMVSTCKAIYRDRTRGHGPEAEINIL